MSLSKTLYLCLVLVQSRKTSPDKTDKLLTGMSNIMAVREQVVFFHYIFWEITYESYNTIMCRTGTVVPTKSESDIIFC